MKFALKKELAKRKWRKKPIHESKQAPASMSPAHLQHYASTGQLSESLPSSQVNAFAIASCFIPKKSCKATNLRKNNNKLIG